jgi:HD-GYP domain-containing protein (c-di-GMP phosphodiesterase class II)
VGAIAEVTASAVQRATLHEETRRQVQHLAALHNIDMTITASMDLRLTLNVLLDQVKTQLEVDSADVLLFQPQIQALEYAAGVGIRNRALANSSIRIGEGFAGQAALERRLITITDLSKEKDRDNRADLCLREGYKSYIGLPLVAKGEVKGVLELFHRTELKPGNKWVEMLRALGTQAAIAIDNATLFEELQRSNIELSMAYDTTLEGWAHALDLRDKETEGHTQRVTEMTMRLAQIMGIKEEDLIHVRRGALLHDIGKMGIPDRILFKPGPLDDEEWEIMRQHPVYAYELLSPIPFLRPALDIPFHHHEKWDGSGYPNRLKGNEIPLAARIFAVVDVWDALSSDRPYRDAWPIDKIKSYIQNQSGEHFDPQVVDNFLRLIENNS